MQNWAARLASLLVALLLGLCWLAVSAQPAAACTCQGQSNAASVRRADAIFLGTVTAKTTVRRPAPGRRDLRFEVSRVYKGTVYAEQVVASPAGLDGCGIDPDLHTTWVVFAEESVQGRGDSSVFRLVSRLCSGNLPTATAPAYLGAGSPPLPGASDREERAAGRDAAVTRAIRTLAAVVLAVGALSAVAVAALWRTGRARS